MKLNLSIIGLLVTLISTASTASQNPVLLEQAHREIKANNYTNIDAMLVYQNGELLTERYYGKFARNTLHRTHSTFKSISTLITLIAIEQNLIGHKEPVMPLLTQLRQLKDDDQRKHKITVQHLLNMSSGLACDEAPGSTGPNHEFGVDEGKTPLAYAMEIPMEAQPGERFAYCNANSFLLTATVSAALARAKREDIFSFANQYLMQPLQIKNYRLTKSFDGRLLNGQGNAYFRPDLAKFGFLLLNGGHWQGKRVISTELVSLLLHANVEINWSFTDTIYDENANKTQYAHQWYITRMSTADHSIELLHSWGNGGQFIIAIPSLEAVIVFTGSNQGNFIKQKQVFDILHTYLLPYLTLNA